MELIIVLLLLGALVVLVTAVLVIWLIASTNSSKERIAELTQRVDNLQAELVLMRRTPSPAPAPAPTPKAEPAPEPKAESTPAPEPLPVVEPAFEPVEFTPTPEPPPPPIIPETAAFTPPPPIIPPLPPTPPPPPPYIRPEIKPEPVAETMQADTMQNSTADETPPPLPTPAKEKASFEMRLGTFWFVRVGIVLVVTSLAFFANYAYHHIIGKLGPAGKISLLYLASGLLLGAGAWWQRSNVKESLKNYAQVLFAGGLAAVYFTTYAAHYIPPLCVITSPLLDGILLLAWAGVIAVIADRRKSEVMALFAVGLAFYSSVITHVGEFTLYSNLILTITAVVFLLRNRWAALSFASLVTSYVGYGFWRFLHPDGWRWAGPDENLWLGAGFLASYWFVFTAATFLSKNEKLSGANRAAFLTLNNGAFFALFLLTMLQVHNHGFWKFSLIYGSVLVALAACARRFLPAEPLTKNTYLTQGLVLVTLGFISKYSGLQLTLVLGAESVMLYFIGLQRQSMVLKFFAYAAALLASGWCFVSLQPFNERGLWTAVALGAFMAANAFRAYWSEAGETASSPRPDTTAFTLLAFASWTAAAWFNTFAPHLPAVLVPGVACLVLYNLVARRQSPVPMIFSFLAAFLAIGWCVINQTQFDPTGIWVGTVLGALMLFNAWSAHWAALTNEAPLRLEPSLFTLLAFTSWLVTTWFNTTGEHLPLVLAAEAVVLTFSIYGLRVREITLLGQSFLILSQVAWLFHFLDATTPPWWNPLAIIAVTIGLSHWWQHQKTLVVSRNIFTCYSTVFALAAVAVALVWLHPLVTAPTWLALTSLLAIGTTAYGLVTRAWPLAICGQIFLAVSAVEFFRQAFGVKPEWFFPLAPIAALGIFSFAAVGWFTRKPDATKAVREPLLQLALAYRWIALLMSLVWIWDYVPERHLVWAYMAAGVVVFALALWRSNREALVATTVYVTASLTMLWWRDYLVMDVTWPNLFALLALFAMQQVLRRNATKMPLAESIHGAVAIIAGLSLWRFVTCWVPTADLFLTMAWAGFALVIFTAGMLLRERFYRWFGLFVLAASVGRVVAVDMWKAETIYRVLTIMALGVSLLLIGFVYNKFQDTIKKWL